MPPANVVDLKTFVPARDFALSKQFYQDLGFALTWGNDQIAEFQVGEYRFLLQNFHVKEQAENFMMSLAVKDAGEWWQHIQQIGLHAKYPGIMCQPPALQPWGLRVLYLSDPSGVLWHIADHLTE